VPEHKREEFIEKLLQIEEHARAAIGDEARLAQERMKFVASVAAYLRISVGLHWTGGQADQP
jgi:hypothetical protein